jgi:hypothetical protein
MIEIGYAAIIVIVAFSPVGNDTSITLLKVSLTLTENCPKMFVSVFDFTAA